MRTGITRTDNGARPARSEIWQRPPDGGRPSPAPWPRPAMNWRSTAVSLVVAAAMASGAHRSPSASARISAAERLTNRMRKTSSTITTPSHSRSKALADVACSISAAARRRCNCMSCRIDGSTAANRSTSVSVKSPICNDRFTMDHRRGEILDQHIGADGRFHATWREVSNDVIGPNVFVTGHECVRSQNGALRRSDAASPQLVFGGPLLLVDADIRRVHARCQRCEGLGSGVIGADRRKRCTHGVGQRVDHRGPGLRVGRGIEHEAHDVVDPRQPVCRPPRQTGFPLSLRFTRFGWFGQDAVTDLLRQPRGNSGSVRDCRSLP